jgi:hypothetical protein
MLDEDPSCLCILPKLFFPLPSLSPQLPLPSPVFRIVQVVNRAARLAWPFVLLISLVCFMLFGCHCFVPPSIVYLLICGPLLRQSWHRVQGKISTWIAPPPLWARNTSPWLCARF